MVKKRPGVWQQVDLIHNIQWLNGSQFEMPPEGLDIQTDDGDGNCFMTNGTKIVDAQCYWTFRVICELNCDFQEPGTSKKVLMKTSLGWEFSLILDLYQCPNEPQNHIPLDYDIHLLGEALKLYEEPKPFLDAVRTCQHDGAELLKISSDTLATLARLVAGEISAEVSAEN